MDFHPNLPHTSDLVLPGWHYDSHHPPVLDSSVLPDSPSKARKEVLYYKDIVKDRH